MLTMQGGDSLVGGLPIIHITYQQYIANPSAYHDPDVIVHITGFPTAGNMPADYVGYDSNLNMEDIGNIATKAIAKVEPSDTALYLHPVGSYFINKDGNACVTDVQISVGGTITLGTNCHVLSKGVANDINSNLTVQPITDIQSGTSNYNITKAYGYKQGKHIHAEVYGTLTYTDTNLMSTPLFSSSVFPHVAKSYVGTYISLESDGTYSGTYPGGASLDSNGFIHETITGTGNAGSSKGFIIDFFID